MIAKNRGSRNVVRVIAVLIPLILLTYAALNFLSVPTKTFNAAVWQRATDTGQAWFWPGNDRRAEMIQDLLDRHLHVGMDGKAARRLLGREDLGDGTGDDGELDIYRLALRPSPDGFRFWKVALWFRYGTTEPALEVQYSKDGRRVTGLEVR